ncbi:MAG: RdgB/HAM1 family non-canonical purine NTP pyrophosphatase [Fibrobacterota bacterium]
MKLLIASGNPHKVEEIVDIIQPLAPQAEILSLKDMYDDVPDIPETGNTFEANSLQKAEWLRSRRNCWVLADDSGLEVDALNGAPGVYSARYAGSPCDDEANNKKLLHEITDVSADERTARYRCVITLLSPEGEAFVFDGACEGAIGTAPRGSKGFGYDPLFTPAGYDATFGELGNEVKRSISHRSEALRKMAERAQKIFTGRE